MTRYTVVAACLAALVSTGVRADDLNPPPFRGQAGSTVQGWDFNTPTVGAPDGPCPPVNPFGAATATITGPSAWFNNFMGMQGVQCLPVGSALNFGIPDSGTPGKKTVWVQVTFHRHNGSDAAITTVPPPLNCSPPIDLPVPGKGPDWVHRTVACCIQPCPPLEVVTITSVGPAGGHLDVGQVVIDTKCDIEQCFFPHPPINPNDYDGDGLPDNCDNAPGISNPNQSDCNNDGLGDVAEPCEICPPGIPAEPEPCGGDTNGGCNSVPPAFTPIACQGQVCGTAWAVGGTRDTDWYQLNLPDNNGDGTAELTIEVCTAIPLVVFLLNTDCTNLVIQASAEAQPDKPAHLDLCLAAPSPHWIFVAPGTLTGGIFDGFPCGSRNQYWLQVFCSDPCGICGSPSSPSCCVVHPTAGCNDVDCCSRVCGFDGFCCSISWDSVCAHEAGLYCHALCCPWDLNGDGKVDGADLGLMLGNWGPNGAADLNDDWTVNGADLGLLLGHWGPC